MLFPLPICQLLSLIWYHITYGSPIGNPPPLSKCFLPPNLSSANILPKVIEQELVVEVSAHRMSGSFTLEQALVIFGGPFHSSPMGLVEKVPGDSQWRTCEGYTTPYNKSPFPGALLAMMATTTT